MSFKNFLRRINRGIVLAIALIIGLTCYLAVDSIAFNEEREIIRQRLEEYARDLTNMMLLPEQFREVGTEAPETLLEVKAREGRRLAAEYFSSGLGRGWSMRDNVAGSLEHMFRGNEERGEKIQSYEANLTRIRSITKHGTNLVTVEADITTTVIATADAGVFNVFFDWGGRYHWGRIYGEETEKAFSSRVIEASFTAEMRKIDGVWVFSSQEGLRISERHGG